MSEIVFILGAGASKEAGAPLMGDFLERANLLQRKAGINLDQNAFRSVFSAISKLQAVHSKAALDLDNLETVFGALEMARVIEMWPGLSAVEINDLHTSFKRVIAQTLEETITFSVSDGQIEPPPAYAKLSEILFRLCRERPMRRCSIISFNYDIALDYALNFHSVPNDYCLEPSIGNTTVPYLKLHGSLNWVRTTNTDRIVAWPASAWFRDRMLSERNLPDFKMRISRRLASERPRFIPEEYDPEPVIIPPTWNKNSYHRSLSNVWQRAAKELSDAEQIFISGYSLLGTDAYFRYLFALGAVGPSRIRRVLIADPDSTGAVKERFKEVLGPDAVRKLDFRSVGFSDMVNSLDDMLD
jgi:hypothetical protein